MVNFFVVLLSAMTSLVVSYFMIRWHMKLICKWMNRFFEEETERMKKFLVELKEEQDE